MLNLLKHHECPFYRNLGNEKTPHTFVFYVLCSMAYVYISNCRVNQTFSTVAFSLLIDIDPYKSSVMKNFLHKNQTMFKVSSLSDIIIFFVWYPFFWYFSFIVKQCFPIETISSKREKKSFALDVQPDGKVSTLNIHFFSSMQNWKEIQSIPKDLLNLYPFNAHCILEVNQML